MWKHHSHSQSSLYCTNVIFAYIYGICMRSQIVHEYSDKLTKRFYKDWKIMMRYYEDEEFREIVLRLTVCLILKSFRQYWHLVHNNYLAMEFILLCEIQVKLSYYTTDFYITIIGTQNFPKILMLTCKLISIQQNRSFFVEQG